MMRTRMDTVLLAFHKMTPELFAVCAFLSDVGLGYPSVALYGGAGPRVSALHHLALLNIEMENLAGMFLLILGLLLGHCMPKPASSFPPQGEVLVAAFVLSSVTMKRKGRSG